jgi:hypothetical protein
LVDAEGEDETTGEGVGRGGGANEVVGVDAAQAGPDDLRGVGEGAANIRVGFFDAEGVRLGMGEFWGMDGREDEPAEGDG